MRRRVKFTYFIIILLCGIAGITTLLIVSWFNSLGYPNSSRVKGPDYDPYIRADLNSGEFHFNLSGDSWYQSDDDPETLRHFFLSLGLKEVINSVYVEEGDFRLGSINVRGSKSVHVWPRDPSGSTVELYHAIHVAYFKIE